MDRKLPKKKGHQSQNFSYRSGMVQIKLVGEFLSISVNMFAHSKLGWVAFQVKKMKAIYAMVPQLEWLAEKGNFLKSFAWSLAGATGFF